MPGVAGLPYGYIHSYKKLVFNHTLFSRGETCIGSLDGPLEILTGANLWLILRPRTSWILP